MVNNTYITKCTYGLVAKNNSKVIVNSVLSIDGVLNTGVCIMNNSTLNSSINGYSIYDNVTSSISIHNTNYGISISNNSTGIITGHMTNINTGIIYSNNSIGEVFNTSLFSSNGINSSNEFHSAVYVQDSHVLLRDLENTSGWGSVTGPVGYTGPTNYRVNGGSILIIDDESLASPAIPDISIGLRGGVIDAVGFIYNGDLELENELYYYQKQL